VPTLRAGDGRDVAYECRGAAAGTPVFLFHGSPGSRLFRPADAVVDAAGAFVVTFDRPGYGGSTPLDGRTLADTAADVVALLDHLGIGRCRLIGWSGGGTFAIATAHALGPRVERLAVVSAPGPLDEVPGGWEQLGPYMRPTAETARREPERARRAIGRHMAPFVADPVKFLGGQHLVEGPDGTMLAAQVREALRQGHAGIAADMIAMWLPWGFALAEVTTPTAVFHGGRDPHNVVDAQCFAARMPNARLQWWPDAGHLGIVEHWPEVLGAVVSVTS
jgi:pimeloyl-ACP methyl ester carboxylesterase